MKGVFKDDPPYNGEEPYLYLAFSKNDRKQAKKILQLLRERGCRVWYFVGPAKGTEELKQRMERATGAELTLLYLSDAAVLDTETKGLILTNQSLNRRIVCLNPDGKDRRLSMGVKESAPEIRLSELGGRKQIEKAILHTEGFSQDLFGERVPPAQKGWLKVIPAVAAVLAIGLIGLLVFRYVTAKPEEVPEPQIETIESSFSDPILLSAVQNALNGEYLTEETVKEITFLSLDGIPASWEDLKLLPALETIELPQQALTPDTVLPDSTYAIRLKGGSK